MRGLRRVGDIIRGRKAYGKGIASIIRTVFERVGHCRGRTGVPGRIRRLRSHRAASRNVNAGNTPMPVRISRRSRSADIRASKRQLDGSTRFRRTADRHRTRIRRRDRASRARDRNTRGRPVIAQSLYNRAACVAGSVHNTNLNAWCSGCVDPRKAQRRPRNPALSKRCPVRTTINRVLNRLTRSQAGRQSAGNCHTGLVRHKVRRVSIVSVGRYGINGDARHFVRNGIQRQRVGGCRGVAGRIRHCRGHCDRAIAQAGQINVRHNPGVADLRRRTHNRSRTAIAIIINRNRNTRRISVHARKRQAHMRGLRRVGDIIRGRKAYGKGIASIIRTVFERVGHCRGRTGVPGRIRRLRSHRAASRNVNAGNTPMPVRISRRSRSADIRASKRQLDGSTRFRRTADRHRTRIRRRDRASRARDRNTRGRPVIAQSLYNRAACVAGSVHNTNLNAWCSGCVDPRKAQRRPRNPALSKRCPVRTTINRVLNRLTRSQAGRQSAGNCHTGLVRHKVRRVSIVSVGRYGINGDARHFVRNGIQRQRVGGCRGVAGRIRHCRGHCDRAIAQAGQINVRHNPGVADLRRRTHNRSRTAIAIIINRNRNTRRISVHARKRQAHMRGLRRVGDIIRGRKAYGKGIASIIRTVFERVGHCRGRTGVPGRIRRLRSHRAASRNVNAGNTPMPVRISRRSRSADIRASKRQLDGSTRFRRTADRHRTRIRRRDRASRARDRNTRGRPVIAQSLYNRAACVAGSVHNTNLNAWCSGCVDPRKAQRRPRNPALSKRCPVRTTINRVLNRLTRSQAGRQSAGNCHTGLVRHKVRRVSIVSVGRYGINGDARHFVRNGIQRQRVGGCRGVAGRIRHCRGHCDRAIAQAGQINVRHNPGVADLRRRTHNRSRTAIAIIINRNRNTRRISVHARKRQAHMRGLRRVGDIIRGRKAYGKGIASIIRTVFERVGHCRGRTGVPGRIRRLRSHRAASRNVNAGNTPMPVRISRRSRSADIRASKRQLDGSTRFRRTADRHRTRIRRRDRASRARDRNTRGRPVIAQSLYNRAACVAGSVHNTNLNAWCSGCVDPRKAQRRPRNPALSKRCPVRTTINRVLNRLTRSQAGRQSAGNCHTGLVRHKVRRVSIVSVGRYGINGDARHFVRNGIQRQRVGGCRGVAGRIRHCRGHCDRAIAQAGQINVRHNPGVADLRRRTHNRSRTAIAIIINRNRNTRRISVHARKRQAHMRGLRRVGDIIRGRKAYGKGIASIIRTVFERVGHCRGRTGVPGRIRRLRSHRAASRNVNAGNTPMPVRISRRSRSADIRASKRQLDGSTRFRRTADRHRTRIRRRDRASRARDRNTRGRPVIAQSLYNRAACVAGSVHNTNLNAWCSGCVDPRKAQRRPRNPALSKRCPVRTTINRVLNRLTRSQAGRQSAGNCHTGLVRHKVRRVSIVSVGRYGINGDARHFVRNGIQRQRVGGCRGVAGRIRHCRGHCDRAIAQAGQINVRHNPGVADLRRRTHNRSRTAIAIIINRNRNTRRISVHARKRQAHMRGLRRVGDIIRGRKAYGKGIASIIRTVFERVGHCRGRTGVPGRIRRLRSHRAASRNVNAGNTPMPVRISRRSRSADIRASKRQLDGSTRFRRTADRHRTRIRRRDRASRARDRNTRGRPVIAQSLYNRAACVAGSVHNTNLNAWCSGCVDPRKAQRRPRNPALSKRCPVRTTINRVLNRLTRSQAGRQSAGNCHTGLVRHKVRRVSIVSVGRYGINGDARHFVRNGIQRQRVGGCRGVAGRIRHCRGHCDRAIAQAGQINVRHNPGVADLRRRTHNRSRTAIAIIINRNRNTRRISVHARKRQAHMRGLRRVGDIIRGRKAYGKGIASIIRTVFERVGHCRGRTGVPGRIRRLRSHRAASRNVNAGNTPMPVRISRRSRSADIRASKRQLDGSTRFRRTADRHRTRIRRRDRASRARDRNTRGRPVIAQSLYNRAACVAGSVHNTNLNAWCSGCVDPRKAQRRPRNPALSKRCPVRTTINRVLNRLTRSQAGRQSAGNCHTGLVRHKVRRVSIVSVGRYGINGDARHFVRNGIQRQRVGGCRGVAGRIRHCRGHCDRAIAQAGQINVRHNPGVADLRRRTHNRSRTAIAIIINRNRNTRRISVHARKRQAHMRGLRRVGDIIRGRKAYGKGIASIIRTVFERVGHCRGRTGVPGRIRRLRSHRAASRNVNAGNTPMPVRISRRSRSADIRASKRQLDGSTRFRRTADRHRTRIRRRDRASRARDRNTRGRPVIAQSLYNRAACVAGSVHNTNLNAWCSGCVDPRKAQRRPRNPALSKRCPVRTTINRVLNRLTRSQAGRQSAGNCHTGLVRHKVRRVSIVSVGRYGINGDARHFVRNGIQRQRVGGCRGVAGRIRHCRGHCDRAIAQAGQINVRHNPGVADLRRRTHNRSRTAIAIIINRNRNTRRISVHARKRQAHMRGLRRVGDIIRGRKAYGKGIASIIRTVFERVGHCRGRTGVPGRIRRLRSHRAASRNVNAGNTPMPVRISRRSRSADIRASKRQLDGSTRFRRTADRHRTRIRRRDRASRARDRNTRGNSVDIDVRRGHYPCASVACPIGNARGIQQNNRSGLFSIGCRRKGCCPHGSVTAILGQGRDRPTANNGKVADLKVINNLAERDRHRGRLARLQRRLVKRDRCGRTNRIDDVIRTRL